MQNLSRITTEYVAIEDRIRISGRVSDEQTTVLWFTQRLVRQLVPVLVKWLEDTAEPESDKGLEEVDDGQGRPAKPVKASRGPSSSITSANTEARPEPVKADKALEQWLVSSVDLKRGTQGVALILRSKEFPEGAALPLKRDQLESWLGILMDCCLRGQWSMDQWPDWMSSRLPGRLRSSLH